MTNYAQSLQAVHDLAQRSGAAVGVALLCSALVCVVAAYARLLFIELLCYVIACPKMYATKNAKAPQSATILPPRSLALFLYLSLFVCAVCVCGYVRAHKYFDRRKNDINSGKRGRGSGRRQRSVSNIFGRMS